MRCVRVAFMLPLLLACVSCSSSAKLNKVQGKVQVNGKPAKGVAVFFNPKEDSIHAVRPSGVTDEEGNFTLETPNQGQGAPAGKYVVTFLWPEEVKKKAFGTEPPDSRDRFEGRYADRSRSKFEVEVKKGDNQLQPFDLK